MPRRTRRSLLQPIDSDDEDEFETPAFRDDKKESEHNDEDIENSDNSDVNISDNELLDTAADSDKDVYGDEGNESDEAPDDVHFGETKEAALNRMKEVVKQISDERQKKKSKRKLLEELYKEQKKQKVETFAKSRLPDDVLEAIPNKPRTQIKKGKGKKNQGKKGQEKTCKIDKDVKRDITGIQDADAFIPLQPNKRAGISVVALSEKKPKTVTQMALEFRNKHLYGRKIPRETSKQQMMKILKRKAR